MIQTVPCRPYDTNSSLPTLWYKQFPADLMVQLRGHSHVEVHVEVIVVGDKGLGRGTTWDHVHERCFHLQKPQTIKEPPHVSDNLGSVGACVHQSVSEGQEVTQPKREQSLTG